MFNSIMGFFGKIWLMIKILGILILLGGCTAVVGPPAAKFSPMVSIEPVKAVLEYGGRAGVILRSIWPISMIFGQQPTMKGVETGISSAASFVTNTGPDLIILIIVGAVVLGIIGWAMTGEKPPFLDAVTDFFTGGFTSISAFATLVGGACLIYIGYTAWKGGFDHFLANILPILPVAAIFMMPVLVWPKIKSAWETILIVLVGILVLAVIVAIKAPELLPTTISTPDINLAALGHASNSYWGKLAGGSQALLLAFIVAGFAFGVRNMTQKKEG